MRMSFYYAINPHESLFLIIHFFFKEVYDGRLQSFLISDSSIFFMNEGSCFVGGIICLFFLKVCYNKRQIHMLMKTLFKGDKYSYGRKKFN